MMNPQRNLLSMTLLLALATAGCTYSGSHSHETPGAETADATPEKVELSPAVKALLTQEMRELQNAMRDVVPALVAGNWQAVEKIGNDMQASYIMKKSLTEEQVHELHESLPARFKQLDHDFHHAAGLMAESAGKQNYKQVSYYYFKLTETCVECHTLYATEKFPEFARKPATTTKGN